MSITDDATATYGQKIMSVEPGGAEQIPLSARHGNSLHLAWTWASPNLEFATVFVGALAVLYYGLDLPTAIIAIVIGNTLASLFHGVLTTWGPRTGLPQMAISRKAFGFWGNILPGGLNAVIAGIGWFAVNSVSGAFALSSLTGMPALLCLLISALVSLALAFFGHNLIHAFERFAFPLLAVVFLVGIIIIAPQTNFAAPGTPIPGAFWIAVSTSFGYTIAWSPLASDYSRYLRPEQAASAGIFAAVGVWASNNVLQVAGAAAVTAVGLTVWNYDNPTSSYTSLLPGWLGSLTLLAIWIGALCANGINLYSSALSFAAIGVRLSSRFARASIAIAAGTLGALLGIIGLNNVASYENFLLLMGYWIGPWLGVVIADHLLFPRVKPATYTQRRYVNLAGPIAMAVAMVVSIGLFSNQTAYIGTIAQAIPELGDITFEIGFVLAVAIYIPVRILLRKQTPDTPLDTVERAETAPQNA